MIYKDLMPGGFDLERYAAIFDGVRLQIVEFDLQLRNFLFWICPLDLGNQLGALHRIPSRRQNFYIQWISPTNNVFLVSRSFSELTFKLFQ